VVWDVITVGDPARGGDALLYGTTREGVNFSKSKAAVLGIYASPTPGSTPPGRGEVGLDKPPSRTSSRSYRASVTLYSQTDTPAVEGRLIDVPHWDEKYRSTPTGSASARLR